MKKLLALEGKAGVEPTINNSMSIPLFLILPRHPLVRPDNAYLRHNHGFTLQWMPHEKILLYSQPNGGFYKTSISHSDISQPTALSRIRLSC